MNGRQPGRVRSEEGSQGGNVGQVAGVERSGKLLGQFTLAAAIMGQCQQLDGDLAGLLVGKMLDESLKSPAVFLTREELVAIDEPAKRHRLLAQGMDDVVVIDDLVMPAVGMATPAGQGHQMRAADEDLEAIVEEAYTKPMSDQAGGHGVEDLAQGEAAGARYRDDHLFEVGGATIGKPLQMRTLGVDALAVCRIAAADNLIDEDAVGAEIVEVPCSAHQQGVANGVLEMAVGAFDRAVLVGDAFVVAGWRHAVVGAQFLIAAREIGLGIGIEVAEGGRQAVAAMIERRAADRPQRVLQAFCQSDEALAAKDDMGVLEARPDEPEVIEQMIERLTGDRYAEVS